MPAGAFADGKVVDTAAVGVALRQVLARSEIQETRALVAVRDTLATSRILNLPATALDSNVDSVVAKEFPLDPDRIGVTWVEVARDDHGRAVYATAWDRTLVKTISDAVRAGGVEPTVIDLKSACLARVVTRPSCVLVDASSNPIEIVLIDDHAPQLWHEQALPAPLSDDLASLLIEPLRAVLRHQKRRLGSRPGDLPVLISSDQPLSPVVMAGLAKELGRPVEALPSPPRVPDIRYATYLTCLGLLMRRN